MLVGTDNADDIIRRMAQKAESYVPEWRFDPENPDIGTAISLVYAKMLAGTYKKMWSLPHKNQIAFFNCLDAKLLPALPSKGYATFGMNDDETEGVELTAGTQLIAPSVGPDSESVSFETQDDIFVTPAKVIRIMETSQKDDYIGVLDNKELFDDNKTIDFFGRQGENLQEHKLYFCQDDAFGITSGGQIDISFFNHDKPVADEYLNILTNPQVAEFSYSTEDGYVGFKSITKIPGGIRFIIGKNDPAFFKIEENDAETYWICCSISDCSALKKWHFDKLTIKSRRDHLTPESVYANEREMKVDDFYPFGEKFSDYNEVYFMSDEALQKKGAKIQLSFNVDYAKIPLDYEEGKSTEWNWVMRKEDFRPDFTYDITIEEVVWEYFNGVGWAPLFDKNRYSDLFSAKTGTVGQYNHLQFTCPSDLAPILVGAREGCCIRARITKVNNLYKMKGYYISPVVDNVSFDYDYDKNPLGAGLLVTENNRTKTRFFVGMDGSCQEIKPFTGIDYDAHAMYLGFDKAPKGGPIKILLDFTEILPLKEEKLLWEYYDGSGWQELDMVDETENMSKTGIVTLMGHSDFSRCELFGEDYYWIRISRLQGQYGIRKKKIRREAISNDLAPKELLPCLAGIYMNSVKIRQGNPEETEYFHMEVYQENVSFPLNKGGLIESRVYVDELADLTRNEIIKLAKEGRLEPEYREDGEMTKAWIKWEMVDNFLDSTATDRHYCLDYIEGVLRFGDGRRGKIPPAGRTDSIRVVYKTGGGDITNVKENSIVQFGKYVGAVNSVTNPKRLYGGCDSENLRDGLKRNAAILRHQNMAVTANDYEEIAFSASRMIQKVHCFSGYNALGERRNGCITLVILQKDYKDGRNRFHELKVQVENYMKGRIGNSLIERNAFSIIEPEFVELSVRAEIYADGFEDVFRIKNQILLKLAKFLDPVSGNFDGGGWEIGTMPNAFQIRNAISDTIGNGQIKQVFLSAYVGEKSNRTEVEMDSILKHKYILPVSGEHEAIIHIR